MVEDREPEGPDHPGSGHQGTVRGLHAAGVEGRQTAAAAGRKRRKQEETKTLQGWDTPVSYEQLQETGYGFPGAAEQDSLEEIVEKEELLEALRRELAQLEELDRTILEMFSRGISEAAIGQEVGLSQKGVNKRKHRLLAALRERLEEYR